VEKKSFAVRVVGSNLKPGFKGELEAVVNSMGLPRSISGIISEFIEVYGYTQVDFDRDAVHAAVQAAFPGLEVKIGRVGHVGQVQAGQYKGDSLTGSIYDDES